MTLNTGKILSGILVFIEYQTEVDKCVYANSYDVIKLEIINVNL